MYKKQVTILAVILVLLSIAGCTKGFDRDSVVKVARKNNLKAITMAGYERRCNGGSFQEEEETYYYVAKDSEEANYIYRKYLSPEENDNVTLKSFVICRDETFMEFGLFTAADNDSANKLYDEYVECFKEDDAVISSGKQGGYIYTIGYINSKDNPGRVTYLGLYKKGKAVFVLEAITDTEQEREYIESVLKDLGFVSPMTLLSKKS